MSNPVEIPLPNPSLTLLPEATETRTLKEALSDHSVASMGVESHLFFSSSGEHPGGSTGRKEGKSLGELTGEEGELALEKAIHRRDLWGGGKVWGAFWSCCGVCMYEVEFREGCGP